jgi:Uma2 family endonuclease
MATAAHLDIPIQSEPDWDVGREKFFVIPADAHTYEGFLRWTGSDDFPENVRVTLVAGEVILDMTEGSLQTHVAVKGEIGSVLYRMIKDEDLGEYYTDGALIGNKAAAVSNHPDGAIVLWETLESGRVRIRRRKGIDRVIEGSPDLVVEIVSEHSVPKDTRKLRKAYHKAQISEYWLIDARGDVIDFQILHWQKKGYVAAHSADGWMSSRVLSRQFRLTRKRNRRDAWTYTLESRTENT